MESCVKQAAGLEGAIPSLKKRIAILKGAVPLSIEFGSGDLFSGKSVRAGVRQGEIHLCGLCGAKVPVGPAILYLVESVTEHLVMGFFAVQEEVDGFADLFVVDLAVQVFIDYFGTLLGRNVA